MTSWEPTSESAAARRFGRKPLFCALALVLASFLVGVAPAQAGSFTGGDPCSLLEGLPAAGHPVRQSGPYKRHFKALDRAKRNPSKLWKAHNAFNRSVAGWLRKAQRVFHPPGERPVRDSRVQSFLSKHVLGKTPALVISDDRFEPPGPVWAALLWTACRGGRRAQALQIAQRAGRNDATFAAFAALLMLDAGHAQRAREFIGPRWKADEGGFLVAFVGAELAPKFEERRRLHAVASRRVSTPDQRQAVRVQAGRIKASPAVTKPRVTKPAAPKVPEDSNR